VDRNRHLAKVGVAGSNPVFRSKIAGQRRVKPRPPGPYTKVYNQARGSQKVVRSWYSSLDCRMGSRDEGTFEPVAHVVVRGWRGLAGPGRQMRLRGPGWKSYGCILSRRGRSAMLQRSAFQTPYNRFVVESGGTEVPGEINPGEATSNQVPPWIDELSFRPGPPWLSMGKRALRDGPLLIEDELHSVYLAEKQWLFANAREVVSVSLPESAEAAAEAAELVSPKRRGPNPFGNLRPLEEAALQVQEDLVVLVRSEEAWRFGAGVVCFPSHWMPGEKLGLSMTAVHDPVPHYSEELAQRVDHFLDHLAPGRNAWRRNWMIHASPQLHVPRPPAVGGSVQLQDLWLRSERQVLWVLPATGGILFTIRTQQCPLRTLATRPDVASSMASSLRSAPNSLRAYRRHDAFNLDDVVDLLETWAG
jgi:hypothetical protein